MHGGNGALVTTDHPGRYALAVEYHPHRGDKPGDFTVERAIEQIRTAIGVADLPVRILHSDQTEFAAFVADRFSSGRVHLIGDAAHVMPPTGGQGGNTAIMDGFYLAWKLAMVVDGLLLGYRYPTGAIVAEPGEDGSLLEDPSAPTGRPGCRAPHVQLIRDGVPISTIDLFGSSFVLLTGSRGERWRESAAEVAPRLGIRWAVHQIGVDGLTDANHNWTTRYGVTDSGAVLVRPDRFIAWRSTEHSHPQHLDAALRRILHR